MSRKRFLLQHLLDLGSRRQPATPVVDAIDAIKVFHRGLMRRLFLLENTLKQTGIKYHQHSISEKNTKKEKKKREKVMKLHTAQLTA